MEGSKKTVNCGICGYESWRDNMRARHFPKKHPGQRYIEQAEKTIPDMFLKPIARKEAIVENESENILQNEDIYMDDLDQIPVEKMIKIGWIG